MNDVCVHLNVLMKFCPDMSGDSDMICEGCKHVFVFIKEGQDPGPDEYTWDEAGDIKLFSSGKHHVAFGGSFTVPIQLGRDNA